MLRNVAASAEATPTLTGWARPPLAAWPTGSPADGYGDGMRRSTARTSRASFSAALACAVVPVLAGCTNAGPAGSGEGGPAAVTSASTDTGPDTGEADHPAVLAAELSRESDETWTLDVTISSEYDSAARYADGWRVLTPEGDVLGEQELTHDHAAEQPFTRTQTGLEIPESVPTVTIEGHDTENGYGGETLEIDVPGR